MKLLIRFLSHLVRRRRLSCHDALLQAASLSAIHGSPIHTQTRETPEYWYNTACNCRQLANIERTDNTITGTLFGHPWVVVIDTL